MAAEKILKVMIHLVSLPHIVLSRVANLLKLESLETDLCQCLEVVDRHKSSVPPVFLNALIIAEDHRNCLHLGIDPIGIIRAFLIRILRGEVQGASTIEQQFVRVVTGRYERTVSRKIREQILALSLVRLRPKSAIASAYLSTAFWGIGYTGLNGLMKKFGCNLAVVTDEQALKFVTQLKYPRPLAPSMAWQAKINRRVNILTYRNRQEANKTMQATLAPRAAEV